MNERKPAPRSRYFLVKDPRSGRDHAIKNVLPIKNLAAAEAEAEMNAFLGAHRVLAVNKEFVADGENSF